MIIFIGGSKTISQLNNAIIRYIDKMCSDNADFLVGDCYGVDKLVQSYLHDKKCFRNI